MSPANFHTHTVFCDGKNTPEELVLAAIKKGFCAIGFSGHSYTPFETEWCMSESGTLEYAKQIKELKQKYQDKISIYLGIEQDFYAPRQNIEVDYIIGSVHYIKKDDTLVPVDKTVQDLQNAAKKLYGGDIYALCADYFKTVSQIKNADIIGHFDLICKFNEQTPLFDETDERYLKPAVNAIKTLCKTNKNALFEINTGAIARGYKTVPYPNESLLCAIKQNGGNIIITADCHDKSFLDCAFTQAERLAEKCGFLPNHSLF